MKLTAIPVNKTIVSTLPETPGVYLFFGSLKTPIYIGKAKSLKNRVGSYFALTLGGKTRKMMDEAKFFSFVRVDSELEALLLEAKLVRKYMPHYNSELKDDKTPLYIGITKEKYPRVLTFRQTQLAQVPLKKTFGPFTSAQTTRRVLKMLRRVFPFCQSKLGKRNCLYRQINLCKPCPSEIEREGNPIKKKAMRATYLAQINKLAKVLGGDIKKVKGELALDMNKHALKEQFEDAQLALRQIQMLELMTQAPSVDAYLENPSFLEDIRLQEEEHLKSLLAPFFRLKEIKRIECFDVAHLAGTFPTASMVTFINGEPDKRFYRHFKVSNLKKNNDVDSLRSVLIRRKKHFANWGMPDLLIVDGGKGQVSGATEVLGEAIPIIGIAKRYETLIIKTPEGFEEIQLRGAALRLVQRLRDEAHRFARRYHHTLVSRALTLTPKKITR